MCLHNVFFVVGENKKQRQVCVGCKEKEQTAKIEEVDTRLCFS